MSKKVNKKTRTALNISKYQVMFRCPVCAAQMKVHDLKSLICSNNHTFDIARQGYLNLITRQIQSNYTKQLFEARRKIITESGFFDRFNKQISQIINAQTLSKRKIALVDMGSGEGSHLNNICTKLRSCFNKIVTGVGIDISKEGILAAAQNYEDTIWLVADIKNAPLNDRMFDVIVNILSPSNYDEFNRLLTDDGVVIKASPRKDYLKELRHYFYKESKQQDYSNEKIVNHFKSHFQLVDHAIVHYTKTLDQSAMKDLIIMTPLTWGVSEKEIHQFLEEGSTEITVAFDLLIGKKN